MSLRRQKTERRQIVPRKKKLRRVIFAHFHYHMSRESILAKLNLWTNPLTSKLFWRLQTCGHWRKVLVAIDSEKGEILIRKLMSVEAIRYQFKKYEVGFFRKQSRLAWNLSSYESPTLKAKLKFRCFIIYIPMLWEKLFISAGKIKMNAGMNY